MSSFCLQSENICGFWCFAIWWIYRWSFIGLPTLLQPVYRNNISLYILRDVCIEKLKCRICASIIFLSSAFDSRNLENFPTEIPFPLFHLTMDSGDYIQLYSANSSLNCIQSNLYIILMNPIWITENWMLYCWIFASIISKEIIGLQKYSFAKVNGFGIKCGFSKRCTSFQKYIYVASNKSVHSKNVSAKVQYEFHFDMNVTKLYDFFNFYGDRNLDYTFPDKFSSRFSQPSHLWLFC